MVDEPTDNAVALQLPELLGIQHLLGNLGLWRAQDPRSEASSRRTMEEITSFQGPPKFESLLNAARAVAVCVFALLTRSEYLIFGTFFHFRTLGSSFHQRNRGRRPIEDVRATCTERRTMSLQLPAPIETYLQIENSAALGNGAGVFSATDAIVCDKFRPLRALRHKELDGATRKKYGATPLRPL